MQVYFINVVINLTKISENSPTSISGEMNRFYYAFYMEKALRL